VVSDGDFAFRAAVRGTKAPALVHGDRRTITRVRVAHVTVTAACATEKGELFLGLADGSVKCFQPRNGAVTALPRHPWPVQALSIDSAGEHVVVLHMREDGLARLTAYRPFEGSYVTGPWRRLDARGAAHLTPTQTRSGEGVVGLWDGTVLSLLRCPGLIPGGRIDLPFDPDDFRGALLLRGDNRAALFDPSSVWIVGTGQVRLPLSWMGAPAGGPLALSPLSWLEPMPAHLALAGVTPGGALFWCWLQVSATGSRVLASATTGQEKYRAAALLRPGHVAAVAADSIHWLRCHGRRFTPWSTTRVDMADAVACFASPLTNELLVVCAEGEVARVAEALSAAIAAARPAAARR
jgi:hypothetical protein